jgi:hypothetical protein
MLLDVRWMADYDWAGLKIRSVKDGILILMPTQKFSPVILLAAIEGFEQQKLRIDAQIAELRAMLPGQPVVTPEAPIAKRRPMSAAARKRMSEAQRKRWAESSAAPASPEPSKPKRKLSAAGKAAIVAALKKRWAAKKAAAVKAVPAVAKKAAPKKAPAKKAAGKASLVKKSAVKKSASALVKPAGE